jgi:hypothetical protein
LFFDHFTRRSICTFINIANEMAANARYEPAPQRDSFEDQQYSQAPPSYQATAEPAPRSEDDNVPDDFKFGGTVAEGTLPVRMQFIRKVYAIL